MMPCQVPNEHLYLVFPKLTELESGEDKVDKPLPKLPRREESKVLSCCESGNIFDGSEYQQFGHHSVSAIEEEEELSPANKLVADDHNPMGQKKASLPSARLEQHKCYIKITKCYFIFFILYSFTC